MLDVLWFADKSCVKKTGLAVISQATRFRYLEHRSLYRRVYDGFYKPFTLRSAKPPETNHFVLLSTRRGSNPYLVCILHHLQTSIRKMAPHGTTRPVDGGSFENTFRSILHLQNPTSRVECPRSPVSDMPDSPATSPSEPESLADTIILDNETPPPPPKASAPDPSSHKEIGPNIGPPVHKATENVRNSLLKLFKHTR